MIVIVQDDPVMKFPSVPPEIFPRYPSGIFPLSVRNFSVIRPEFFRYPSGIFPLFVRKLSVIRPSGVQSSLCESLAR